MRSLNASWSKSRTGCKHAALRLQVWWLSPNHSDERGYCASRIWNRRFRSRGSIYTVSPDEVSLDFEVQGPSATNAEMNDVLLLAACRARMLSCVKTHWRSVGLLPGCGCRSLCDGTGHGLIFPQLESGNELLTVAVVDIGATMTTLSVLADGKTIYTREQLFGGKQLTEIQRRYGLSRRKRGWLRSRVGCRMIIRRRYCSPSKRRSSSRSPALSSFLVNPIQRGGLRHSGGRYGIHTRSG